MTPDSKITQWEGEAREWGEDSARAAASWTTDGNSDVAERARVLAMMRDGDGAAFDYLPPAPNLSGEWADGPTPASLLNEIVGVAADQLTEDELAEAIDAISTAWELGVSETFESACEAELVRFCGDE